MCEFRKETNVEKLTWSQMDNSSEEIAFVIEEKFSSFSKLKDKIKEFEKTTLCNCSLGIQDQLRRLLNVPQRSSLMSN